jgi:hypothetical protein
MFGAAPVDAYCMTLGISKTLVNAVGSYLNLSPDVGFFLKKSFSFFGNPLSSI